MKVFIGYDERQPVAYHVLAHSIWRRASRPVSIQPLMLKQLPMTRTGLTEFTYSRFMVPYLCGYTGPAIFIDSDFLCLSDICELFDIGTKTNRVAVVKNKLTFEWASMMLFNCGACLTLKPEYIDDERNALYDFKWAESNLTRVGELPAEWNHLVGYDDPNPHAKLIHFTQGIPCFPETVDSEFANEWQAELQSMTSTCTWEEIMGHSVHKKPVLERLAKAA